MVTTRRASKAKAQVDSMGLFRVLADAEIGNDLLPQDAAGRLESTCSGLLRVVRSQRSRLVLPSVAASVKGLERCDVVDGWLAALERYPLASYVDGSSVREDVFDILLVGLGAALSAGRFKVLARVGAPPECSDILRYQLEQSFQIETEPSLSDGMRGKVYGYNGTVPVWEAQVGSVPSVPTSCEFELKHMMSNKAAYLTVAMATPGGTRMTVSWREGGHGLDDTSLMEQYCEENPDVDGAGEEAHVKQKFACFPFYTMFSGLTEHQRPEVKVEHKAADFVETARGEFVGFRLLTIHDFCEP